MQAVMIDEFKTPGTLREVAVPEPGSREVLVRTTVAGVNPIDWKVRSGAAGPRPMPLVLGQDFAGHVERVGSEVREFSAGDRVFGIARAHGSYAQYTVVALDQAFLAFAKLPADVGDEVAAALPTPALTALASLEILEVRAGSTLAIVGAAGSLGAAAVQLAKRRGAHTIAIVKKEQFADARSFGANDVVDADGDIVAQIRALDRAAGGVDAVLDTVASDQAHLERWQPLVKSNGALVSTNHAADESWFRERGVRATNVTLNETPQSSAEGLGELIDAIRSGDLRVEVGERGRLDQAASYLDRGEKHELHGKAVLVIN